MELEVGDKIRIQRLHDSHECLITHVDPKFIVLLLLPQFNAIYILQDKDDLQRAELLHKGRGIIEDADKQIMQQAFKKFSIGRLFDTIVSTVLDLKSASENSSDDRTYIKIDGMVDTKLAMKWKHIVAIANIYDSINVDPPDIQKALLEWTLIVLLGLINNYDELKDDINRRMH